MRDLLEKALNKGLSVVFSTENGFAVIRILKGEDVVASCSLDLQNLARAVFRERKRPVLTGLCSESERQPCT